MDDRFAAFRSATAAALLTAPGTTSPQLRQAIADGNPPADLKALIQKIRARAYSVTDQDVETLKACYSEDQLFEIIVAAAFGAARDRLEAAHKALDEA